MTLGTEIDKAIDDIAIAAIVVNCKNLCPLFVSNLLSNVIVCLVILSLCSAHCDMCVYTSKVSSLKVILLCVMIGSYITLIVYSEIATKGGAGMQVGLGLVILY